MFLGAEAFNQNICGWDVDAEVFNQYIGRCKFSSYDGFDNKPTKQILMFVITTCLILTAF
jgi:hypothetical protein